LGLIIQEMGERKKVASVEKEGLFGGSLGKKPAKRFEKGKRMTEPRDVALSSAEKDVTMPA